MKPLKIRPIAICVFRHAGKILVFQAYDQVKREFYYRPLGGGIEPGEYGKDTIVREIREEIGAQVTNLRYLAALENIFVANGQPGHEIVLVFDGDLVDAVFYEQTELTITEDSGESLKAYWKPLDYFRQANAAPLYPDGLLNLLSQMG